MKAKIQLPACYKKEAEAYIAKLEAEYEETKNNEDNP
jgi:hypothetical protein